MPQTVHFHLDEHVPLAVAHGLRLLGIDVTTTTDAGLLSASDAVHIAFGITQGRVIVTQDVDFLVLATSGAVHAGIVYFRKDTLSIDQIIRALDMLRHVYEPLEMHNRIEFL